MGWGWEMKNKNHRCRIDVLDFSFEQFFLFSNEQNTTLSTKKSWMGPNKNRSNKRKWQILRHSYFYRWENYLVLTQTRANEWALLLLFIVIESNQIRVKTNSIFSPYGICVFVCSVCLCCVYAVHAFKLWFSRVNFSIGICLAMRMYFRFRLREEGRLPWHIFKRFRDLTFLKALCICMITKPKHKRNKFVLLKRGGKDWAATLTSQRKSFHLHWVWIYCGARCDEASF